MLISEILSEAVVRIILCTLITSMLIGCSSLSEQAQLAQKNQWHDVGVVDGNAGHYQRAKFELNALNTLDNIAYEEYKHGYLVGIEEFCQPEKTYLLGEKGDRYKGQCANTSQEEIAIEKWNEGYDAYMLETSFIFFDEYSDYF